MQIRRQRPVGAWCLQSASGGVRFFFLAGRGEVGNSVEMHVLLRMRGSYDRMSLHLGASGLADYILGGTDK